MSGLVITLGGMEAPCLEEIQEITGKPGTVEPTVVMFTSDDPLIECLAAYRSQSALYVMHLLFTFSVEKDAQATLGNIRRLVKGSDLADWLTPGRAFKVETTRVGTHEFNSPEFSSMAGEVFLEAFPYCKVKMEGYDLLLRVYICGNRGYCGIDLAGFETGKRDYRIFSSSHSFKAPIYYAAVRLARLNEGQLMIDPFCTAGDMAIEAALYAAGKSINYYRKQKLLFTNLFRGMDDAWFSPTERLPGLKIHALDASMRSVMSAKKNSKIAGVNQRISFSRMDLDWLDTKYGKNTVDAIITALPSPSRALDARSVEKIQGEFFHQASYILKAAGRLCVLSSGQPCKDACAGFIIESSETIFSGQQPAQLSLLRPQK